MEKFVCIHGHFYQPPRENAWLEDVELQDTAYPYHDWNERITEECYKQNAASRILGSDKKIVDIVNNYESMSFNFGPTLLSWLEKRSPDVYRRILVADHKGREHYSGHGPAIAQAYNHMIMPLACERDKHTQVIWGIWDFEKRFERKPEGMWLPETAVDLATLEVLAEHGIQFTILAPRQAKRVKLKEGKRWKQVDEQSLDTSVPYVCSLPSGRTISIFFYNGPTSHDIAYGGLLHDGETFAKRLAGSFGEDDGRARLVHIATDGESFGHHHRHGDMALAYCIHHIETNEAVAFTVYGEFLEKYPPEDEVEIWDGSSWSCAHGVERWKSNCGCASNHAQSGKQQWREPLRNAMDWLRDSISGPYEERMREFCDDPWAARNDYIDVIMDRSQETVDAWIAAHVKRELSGEEKIRFIKLLEMQRNAMLMYTSCGWFFDSVSGIETTQIMQYAARAMQLFEDVFGTNLEPEYEQRLEAAPTNVNLFENGRDVYQQVIQPAKIDLARVAGHFALSSVIEKAEKRTLMIYSYSADIENSYREEAGLQVLTLNRATIHSTVTLETRSFDLIGLYLGSQNLFATLGPRLEDAQYEEMKTRLSETFRRGDTIEVLRMMNVWSEGQNYSLTHLFRDQRRRLVNELLETTWAEIENSFRHIYEYHYSILQLLRNMNMPLPKPLSAPAEFVINQDLRRAIQADAFDVKRVTGLIEEVRRLNLTLDKSLLKYEARYKLNQMMIRLEMRPTDTRHLEQIEKYLDTLSPLIPDMDMQVSQNIFFELMHHVYPGIREKANSGDADSKTWVEHITNLAQLLGLALP